MRIYLDFDGTIVEHQYPSIGKYNNGCFEVIEKLFTSEHMIILNTYRADCKDGTLQEAITYLKSNNLFKYISKVLESKIEPSTWSWELHFEKDMIFLDDICDGIPTIYTNTAEYEIVDWHRINEEFEQNRIY